MGTEATDSSTLLDMAASDRQPRRFHRKLAAILNTHRVDRLDLDRAAGLPAGSVSGYLAPSRLVVPNPGHVVRLVRGLREFGVYVDMEWFCDESDESPIELPHEAYVVAARFNASTLLKAQVVHYVRTARQLDAFIDQAEGCEWADAAVWMLTNFEDDDEPASYTTLRELAYSVEASYEALLSFNLTDAQVLTIASELVAGLGSLRAVVAERLTPSDLAERFERLIADHPGLLAISKYQISVYRHRRGGGPDPYDSEISSDHLATMAGNWLRRWGRQELAGIVTHPSTFGLQKYDKLRRELVEEGWIGKEDAAT
ncbi:MAG: hypothetical protein AAF823_14385 [Planctomycetota bacterium]